MRNGRIEREKKTVERMIEIYCKWNNDEDGLCSACEDLLEYAHERLDRCPFGNGKPSCKDCEIHCYSTAMRQRIKEVMRYSGPRMLLKHPILTIRHLIDEKQRSPKRKINNNSLFF